MDASISTREREQPLLGGLAAAASNGVYLGHVEAVQLIVADFVDAIPEVVAQPGDSSAAVAALCDRMALRFALGAEGDSLIPDWHTASRMGRYVAQRMGLDDNLSLIETLRLLFTLKAGQVLQATVDEVGGRRTRESVEFELEAMVEEVAAALTGTWEAVYPAEEVEA